MNELGLSEPGIYGQGAGENRTVTVTQNTQGGGRKRLGLHVGPHGSAL